MLKLASSYKFSDHSVQNWRCSKRILFGAGWFEMGILGRKREPVSHCYCISSKIVSAGHIRNSETYLWARGEAKGLIKWSRWFFICPRGYFNHNIHNFIYQLLINLCPGIHKRQERYKITNTRCTKKLLPKIEQSKWPTTLFFSVGNFLIT